MRRNKNYTLYLIFGISTGLTVPIAAIIINRVEAGNLELTLMIMGVFLVLFMAILLLYKNVFGVSVQEIAQDEKVTELDRFYYTLLDYRKRYRNPQLKRYIDLACEQILRFKRRKNVFYQVAGTELTFDGALKDLVQIVEDAIVINLDKLTNRVEIFDDQGIPEIIRQNLGYIEDFIHKNNVILMEFETLITETSRIGEVHSEKDISTLRDVVNAMQSLRAEHNDNIDELAKKYEKEG